MEQLIKRGDIYYYDFGNNPGSIQCGNRPVLCLQANNFNVKAPTIIVAAITTVIKKQYLPSHVILPDTTGLKEPSMVLLEQIRSVNKSDLARYVGSLNDEQTWRQVNNAIKKTFGLWIYRPGRSGEIRCLCNKCLRDYMADRNYVVRRLDPFDRKRDRCFKCDNLGYDYLVYDKRMQA